MSRPLASVARHALALATALALLQDEELKTQLYSMREAVGRWRASIATGPRDRNALQATLYQRALFSDLDGTLAALKAQDFREPLRAEDLPPGVRSRFIGRSGKILLQIYPRGNVWEHEAQEVFVRELRTINPAVTGSPILIRSAMPTAWSILSVTAARPPPSAMMAWPHFSASTSPMKPVAPAGAGATSADTQPFNLAQPAAQPLKPAPRVVKPAPKPLPTNPTGNRPQPPHGTHDGHDAAG